jgi:hypothetical protein
MAVTAHFMMRNKKGYLIFKAHLIAFRFIIRSHSGAHLGQEFLKITDDLEISNKVRAVFIVHIIIHTHIYAAWSDNYGQRIQQ